MTSYHGGKQQIGAEIAQIIKKVANRVEEQTGKKFRGYLEPFCGMLGVSDSYRRYGSLAYMTIFFLNEIVVPKGIDLTFFGILLFF